MAQLRTVNKALAHFVPALELVKADDYFYFIFDDGGDNFETETILVPRISDFSLDRWVDLATSFHAKQMAAIQERATWKPIKKFRVR